MIITLNGFSINDPNGTTGVYLDEPVDGLGMPPIRTSSGNFNGRDGGYVSAQFYGMRLITLTGNVFGSSAADLDTKRQAFEAAVATSPITMNITTNGGLLYTMTCYIDTSLDMSVMRSPTKSPFKLSLVAPDPNIYDNSSSGSHTATIPLSLGGGITWPISWNPITWAAGGLPTTINNTGNVLLYPTLTLTNQVSNPTLTNVTTGQFFFLSGLTTGPGDVIAIDMKNRTVLLNGGSVLPYLSSASAWWPLLVGNNTIKLTSSNSSDPVTATITWRSGVRGI